MASKRKRAELQLPPDLPVCPDPTLLELDPGLHVRKRVLDGPRRPVLARRYPAGESNGLLPPQWAAEKWRMHESGRHPDPSKLFGSLYLWLSSPQLDAWFRQVGCPRCGAGIGYPCFARGLIGPLGPERVRAATYHHKGRIRLADRLALDVPRWLYPGWIWWAMSAVGNDLQALGACMLSVQDAAFVEQYVSRLPPEIAAGW